MNLKKTLAFALSGFLTMSMPMTTMAAEVNLETPSPTMTISGATAEPVIEPTTEPTEVPTEPTETPAEVPTEAPTEAPTEPTKVPTEVPTVPPTTEPTEEPTETPSVTPTETPTIEPTEAPTESPSGSPNTTESPDKTATPSVSPDVELPEEPNLDEIEVKIDFDSEDYEDYSFDEEIDGYSVVVTGRIPVDATVKVSQVNNDEVEVEEGYKVEFVVDIRCFLEEEEIDEAMYKLNVKITPPKEANKIEKVLKIDEEVETVAADITDSEITFGIEPTDEEVAELEKTLTEKEKEKILKEYEREVEKVLTDAETKDHTETTTPSSETDTTEGTGKTEGTDKTEGSETGADKTEGATPTATPTMENSGSNNTDTLKEDLIKKEKTEVPFLEVSTPLPDE